MTSYYIEIRKSRRRKRKAKFWEVDDRVKTENGQLTSERTKKDAYETLHNRATRQNSGNSIIFSLGPSL